MLLKRLQSLIRQITETMEAGLEFVLDTADKVCYTDKEDTNLEN